MGKKRDKEDIEKARAVLEREPHWEKVRMPDMKRFKYCVLNIYPGIGRQIIISILGTIGVFVLIAAFVVEDTKAFIIMLLISILLLSTLPLYFIYIFRSTKKLGGGRYTVNTNFYYHDDRGIYYTSHLDRGEIARFVPWGHIKQVNYHKSSKYICVVPEAMFKVTKSHFGLSKIDSVMLSLKNEGIRELVLAIYDNDVPVMSKGKKVYRSDLIKIHNA